MSPTKVRWIAIFATLAIAAIIWVQGYWVYSMWNLKEKDFTQGVKVSLYQVAKQLVELNGSVLPNTGIINQVSSNYFIVNINDRIKFDHLEYFLSQEFQNSNVNEDFEFGIYDCSNDEMVYGNYVKANTGTVKQPKIKSFLPTHEGLTYYFGVLFPTKNSAIIANMKWVFLISFVLILAIGILIYSILALLRQNVLSELQKDFINNMTHEFKTPIASIKLATNAISNDQAVVGNKRLTMLSGIVDQQNKRLNAHVEKILQLAKLEKDKFLLSKTSVDLNDVIREILPAVEFRVEQLNGKLETNLFPEPLIIMADALHLTNVLENLIDNAIKYSLENPVVCISSTLQKDTVVLSIDDQGVGMDLETQRKVFDKFYRHHTGNIHDVKGFGLGLFYVKNICKAHHWKLQILSTPKKGTIIKILIPKK